MYNRRLFAHVISATNALFHRDANTVCSMLSTWLYLPSSLPLNRLESYCLIIILSLYLLMWAFSEDVSSKGRVAYKGLIANCNDGNEI